MSIKLMERLRNHKSVVAGVIMGLSLGAGVAGAMSALTFSAAEQNLGNASLLNVAQVAPVSPPKGAPMSFADMIARVSPAVVSIEAKGTAKPEDEENPGFPFMQPQPNRQQPTRSAGSGFFISADGYIVTNNHVIDGADEITVTLTSEKKLKAKVIGRDAATDLAVIKVEGKAFPFVNFELKHRPRVGDWVVAVGNPFGFAGSATAGIVSAHGRDLNAGGANYVDYLQIDAAINRGNSGGPTFDLYGRVIGVNTIIVTPSGANAGVGFAIPADVAHKITAKLMTGVKIERGYIGVSIQNVTEDIAKALNLKDLDGAYVIDVAKGGPAERAGIELGDVVKSVNGVPIKSPTELTRKIAEIKNGEKLTLQVLRAGKLVTLTLTATLRPSEDLLAQGADIDPQQEGPLTEDNSTVKIIGLSVKPLSPALRRQYRIEEDVKGLVITSVEPESEAGKEGVKAGDVIVRADSRPLNTREDFAKIIEELKKAGRPSVLLLINREGRNVPLPLPLK